MLPCCQLFSLATPYAVSCSHAFAIPHTAPHHTTFSLGPSPRLFTHLLLPFHTTPSFKAPLHLPSTTPHTHTPATMVRPPQSLSSPPLYLHSFLPSILYIIPLFTTHLTYTLNLPACPINFPVYTTTCHLPPPPQQSLPYSDSTFHPNAHTCPPAGIF